jgi:hypothetical protein
MNPRIKPLVAAISGLMVAAGAWAGETPDIATQARQVIVNAEMVAAADTAGEVSRQVIVTRGSDGAKHVEVFGSGDVSGLGDLDTVISGAIADAMPPGLMMHAGKSVKNAPYSAEVITEKLQALPDGNQISKKTSTSTYRDSAGRTRQEIRDAKGEIKTIFINDTVERTQYTLSPAKKTATKMVVPDLSKNMEELRTKTRELREKAKAMAKDGKATITEKDDKGDRVIIKHIETQTGEGKVDIHENVKINVVRAGGDTVINGVNVGEIVSRAMSDAAVRTGPLAFSFQDMKWSAKATTTPLGTKDFDGVRAEGKSVSYTIPAGEVGNKNPITVTTETWYSPELQITVYTKHSDPRVGDTIFRLANLKRSDPPSALFSVPTDYALKETKGFSFHTSTDK